jgi:hypothetical protein
VSPPIARSASSTCASLILRCPRRQGLDGALHDRSLDEVWFYLRGEEYSAQIDYFAQSIKARRLDGENSFESALDADRVVARLLGDGAGTAVAPGRQPRQPSRPSVWSRLFG